MIKKRNGLTITFIVIDALAIIALFLFYGPLTFIKDFIVTNGMTTLSHQYLPKTFYTDAMIADVMERNKVLPNGESTDINAIKVGSIKEQTTYESIYEEQILNKDNDNDLYKILTIEEDGYKAFLAVIYDPSRLELVSSSNKGKQKIDEIVEENNAKIGINASGYVYGSNRTKIPLGSIIMDGKVIQESAATGYGGGIIGFNKDHILNLIYTSSKEAVEKYNIIDGMEFGPFLIVNGKITEMKGDGGWGKAQRTAIAQRKDGIVLLLVSDGRQYSDGILGMSMKQMANLFLRYGAYNAANMDGGNSAIMFANNQYINTTSTQEGDGGRNLPNAWIVK